MVGIPFMLSVLADVGGLMAEGIEYTWLSNRDRLRLLAEKLNIIKPRKVSDAPWCERSPGTFRKIKESII